MSHIEATVHSVSMLEADDLRLMRWCVDTSFAVCSDMRGHTGGELALGKEHHSMQVTNKKSMTKVSQKLRSLESTIQFHECCGPIILWEHKVGL